MFDPQKPYYDLPLVPPKQNLETIELYKELIPATSALAKLSATAEHLPNQAALHTSVTLLEAKASSEIEQIITTDQKLFTPQSELKNTDPMTKEVHRYGEAMHHGWQTNKPLCTTVMEEICSIIRHQTVNVRKVPGTTLKKPNGEIVYTPPDGDHRLRDLLDNLFNWMNQQDDTHPIIKAAIAHYQFESIHPFTDGNGRTGRIMVVLYLVEQQIFNAPVLFLSGEILNDKQTYYQLLQTTHQTNDFTPYLIWFLRLIQRAATQSTIRANKVRQSMQQAKTALRKIDPKLYSQDLINVLFSNPLIFANHLTESDVAGSTSTAHLYLKKLETNGLLIKSNQRYGKKSAYISHYFLDALRGEVDIS